MIGSVSNPQTPGTGEAPPRPRCLRCWRPTALCLCAGLTPMETRTRVVILQHRRESSVPVNTARLAALSLPRCELHVGVDFERSALVRARLEDPEARPILLFPGAEARPLEREAGGPPITLFVVDGTWSQARKVVNRNPSLAKLPRYALAPDAPSRYRIRREPAADCLSTIEAIALALAVLEGRRFDALLRPFDVMVAQQLAYAETVRSRRQLERGPRPRPPLLTLLGRRATDLVIGYGEANAWPRGSTAGEPAEIVHFAAERVATGERLDAMVAPRRALSPSFTHHTGIPAAVAHGAGSSDEFRRGLSGFLRPTDLLCVWGHYAAALVASEGVRLPEVLDVRAGVRRMLHRTPGDVHACAEHLGGAVPEPWAMGRTGARLAALRGVIEALLARSAG